MATKIHLHKTKINPGYINNKCVEIPNVDNKSNYWYCLSIIIFVYSTAVCCEFGNDIVKQMDGIRY